MNDTKSPGALHAELRACRQGRRRELLLQRLATILNEILDTRGQVPISPADRIFDLGLGSLVVVELKSRLEHSMAEPDLPVTLFFKHATVGELADHLLALVDRRDERGPVAALPLEHDNGEGSSLETVRSMSEDEAEAAMLEKLAQIEKESGS